MEKHQCEGMTKQSQWNDYQCTRDATVCRKECNEEGEWYCWQHDPHRIAEKDMEANH